MQDTAVSVEPDRLIVAMWFMRLTRRFPARESRRRFCSLDNASKNAVPVQEACGFLWANR